jgi:hypothetical protein
MRKYLAVALFAWLAGCGYVAAPLAPALHIPVKVTDLRAIQQGSSLVVGFTITGKTTDNLVIGHLREIDLRAGPDAKDTGKWEGTAKRIPVEPPKIAGLEARTSIAGLGWEDKDIRVAVRAVGPTGRAAQWSDPLIIHVVAIPPAPIVSAVSSTGGITLQWTSTVTAAGTKWRVTRTTKVKDQPPTVVEVPGPGWLDTAATEEDQTYTYQVQALVPAGKGVAEGDMSKAVTLTYKDVFPPAVPVGLTTIVGVKSVELAWEPNREPDLKGYQVWRAEGSNAPERLGDLTTEVTYSDKTIVSGKHYRYFVSAIDTHNNPSAKSAAVDVTVP